MWFEALSRLNNNLEISVLIPLWRVDAEDLATEVGCKVRNLLAAYWGMPLIVHYKSMAVWDGVEESF